MSHLKKEHTITHRNSSRFVNPYDSEYEGVLPVLSIHKLSSKQNGYTYINKRNSTLQQTI